MGVDKSKQDVASSRQVSNYLALGRLGRSRLRERDSMFTYGNISLAK